MICPHCGSVIPDGSIFCSQCGARLDMPKEPGVGTASAAAEIADLVPEVEPVAEAGAASQGVPPVPADAAAADLGETVVAPQGFADLGDGEGLAGSAAETVQPEPVPAADAVPEVDQTLVAPGGRGGMSEYEAAAELSEVPTIEEPADMPAAIPLEGTPVVMPEEPEVPQVPAEDIFAEQAPAAPEPSVPEADATAVRPLVAEPIGTISSGAAPILQVPVNRHDTADFRASVMRKHRVRAQAPREAAPYAHAVSRASYESHMQDESYAQAASYAEPVSAAVPEEAESLEAHARRAETALVDNDGYYVPYAAPKKRSHVPLIVGICAICAVAIGAWLFFSQNGLPAQPAETAEQTETSTDTAEQTQEAPSPVTQAGDVSYNSDTGELTMEKYGFSATLPAGMTATASSDGSSLELDDATTGMHISAWVRANSKGVTLDSASDEAMSVSHMTYAHVSTLNNWFVVSHWEGETDYYIREYVDSSRILAIEFTYPRANADAGSQIIEDMTNTIQMNG